MKRLKLVYVDPNTLTLDPDNIKIHTSAQIDELVKSIDNFGFNVPIQVNDEGIVVAGNGRLKAAIKLGLAKVPSINVSHMTPEQQRAFAAIDNALAESGTFWTEDGLEMIMPEIEELGFDLGGINFAPTMMDDFRPNLEPDGGGFQDVTKDDINQAEGEKQDVPQQKKYTEITCPHCFDTFTLEG